MHSHTPLAVPHRRTYEFLAWFGIVGSALTVLANLDTLLKLAHWVDSLALLWREWTSAAWTYLAAILRISIPDDVAAMLNYGVCVLCIAIGARMSSVVDRLPIRTIALNTLIVLGLVVAVCAAIVAYVAMSTKSLDLIDNLFLAILFAPIILSFAVLKIAKVPLREVPIAVLNILLLATVSMTFFVDELFVNRNPIEEKLIFAVGLFTVPVIVALIIARPSPLLRRLVYKVAIILAVFALSELSKIPTQA